jgi:hypothetical protein
MRKTLLLFLVISISAFAGDASFDSSFLDQLPARRAQVLAKSKSTAVDSTSDINAKQEKYYLTLKADDSGHSVAVLLPHRISKRLVRRLGAACFGADRNRLLH